jgi:hypothetical protein
MELPLFAGVISPMVIANVERASVGTNDARVRLDVSAASCPFRDPELDLAKDAESLMQMGSTGGVGTGATLMP